VTLFEKSVTNELVKHIHKSGVFKPIEALMNEASDFISCRDRVVNPVMELEECLRGPIYLGPPLEKKPCSDCGQYFPEEGMFRFFPHKHRTEHFHVCGNCWKGQENRNRHKERTNDGLIECR